MTILKIICAFIAFILLYDTSGSKKKSKSTIRRSNQYNNRAYRNKQVKKLCSPEKEKEMEVLGLEEWQKDLVREGSYYKDDTW